MDLRGLLVTKNAYFTILTRTKHLLLVLDVVIVYNMTVRTGYSKVYVIEKRHMPEVMLQILERDIKIM